MLLKISHDTKVRDVRNLFRKEFPFLKIEFFRHPHETTEDSPASQKITLATELGKIPGFIREGELEIKPEDMVWTIEKAFQDMFGLPVQVFRMEADQWIQTTATDFASLRELNEKGMATTRKVQHPFAGSRYIEDREY